jgi:cell division protease FtsH
MAQALIKYETIDSEQIADIMGGHEPRPPKDWGQDSGSSSSGRGASVSSPGKSSGDVDGGKIAGPPPAEQH